ncbi:SusD/RagB family nutrient-binding outer membrane lipoprotein [Sediminibacterium ginsengisoli]|uniref:Starch-binding associating with outer membrane n=1 Tax=Sediminibacterium ginsengisoli TaxID=413434 RepID=A0A1T4K7S3_9BACT|nr:SusD/RagB family nutrient-binding outer membrane lipoprotein [Sediminibacterium ginsengisoli]SJZ38498.1 Starch-binding associating with outer membrane [Sediminibacterium ginsengisoli]
MKQFFKISFIGTALILLVSGCKKFVDVNTNPNNAVTTKAQFVFTGALGNSYRIQTSAALMVVPGSWVGFYGHSTSFTGGGAEKTYDFTTADFNAFDGIYDNIGDYQYVITNADRDGVAFLKDPANVMQCYMFQQLVDMYGNVPYTDALKGVTNITPTYTDQKVIYEDLVVRLDSAMARIARATWPTDASLTAQDVYFQGAKDSWIRFANTIKLRILMRQSFMPGRDTYITTNINNTIARGYIQQNVLVSPGYQNIAGKLNPFYANYGYNELNNVTSNHQYRKMGAPIINWLKNSVTTNARPASAGTVAATADADTFRLQGLAWPIGTTPSAPSNTLSNYVGIPLGAGSGFATASSSPIGPFQVQVGQGTRPGMLMLLAEAYFLQAEAAQRYGVALGTAQSLYESGILAHFRTVAAPSTAGNASNTGDAYAIRYYSKPIQNVGWAASTDKIRAILIQKWVSLEHINGLEAWSEYRKSSGSTSVGVPILPATVASTSNPEPVRYLYPQTEYDANTNNVPASINRFTSKIFWDVN